MALTTLANSNKNLLNQANPNKLASLLQQMGLGDVLRAATKTKLVNQAPAVNPYNLATVQAISLPDDAKAATILRAYARAGTAAVGELTVNAAYATPATTTISVAPNGDIVLLGTDAYTSVDVLYEPDIQDVLEFTLPVVPGTGVCALPASVVVNGVAITPQWNMLLEAEALAGTVTGKAIVVAPGAVPGTTHQANLSAAKSQAQFKITDAVTSARVKLGFGKANDFAAFMEANATT